MQKIGKNTHRIIIYLFLLFLCAVSLQAQEPICDYCQKKIVHPEYYTVNGKHFHKAHFKCDHCGKRLKGKFQYYHEKFYHLKCYDKYIAIRCALCGLEIIDMRFTDYWGNKYHSEHRDGVNPRCEYCRRFISEDLSKGGFRLKDGRVVCGICDEMKIPDFEAAMTLMGEVRDTMATLGMEINLDSVALRLVSKDGMAQRNEGKDIGALGLAKSKNLANSRERIGKSKVYILFGLPRFAFIKVIAHELMHVWMSEHRCVYGTKILREGSCNYAAYLVLQKYDDPYARFEIDGMEGNRNVYYGSGFREVKKFIKDNGVDYWLDYIETNNSLPQLEIPSTAGDGEKN